MNDNISVIYQNGVLKPVSPLKFPENTELVIQIIEPPTGISDETMKSYLALYNDGLLTTLKMDIDFEFTDLDRREAAVAYGKVGPLSELIIAERDE